MTATTAPTAPGTADLAAVKAKQQATWSSGDYAIIGTTLQITGEVLCESVDVRAGARVLDVAAGNGNAALAAARRGCDVTASDYVPELLERAAQRATAEGLPLRVEEADAEALPFADATFDFVLSTFGVMFTPDHRRAASELVRVCRPQGRIGVASWTPDSFVGQMFKVVGAHVPPPAGVSSPLLWGTDDHVVDLFGGHAVSCTTRQYVFRYRSVRTWVDTFRTFYGPTLKAFGALDPDARARLESDLVELATAANTATDGSMRIPSDYLEVVVVTAG